MHVFTQHISHPGSGIFDPIALYLLLAAETAPPPRLRRLVHEVGGLSDERHRLVLLHGQVAELHQKEGRLKKI